ncbi:MAG: aminotransferase class V-fold PLP-dependent enzyme [Trueperaceae bacterium]
MTGPAWSTVPKARLAAPGPVEVPPFVLEAMARPPLHHRTEAFSALLLEVRRDLARLTCVAPDPGVLLLPGSGTTAFEAALRATVPEGGRVVTVHAGRFGERWAEMARALGHPVDEATAPWGEPVAPEAVADVVRRVQEEEGRTGAGVAAVTLVHSETSTGVLHDVRAQAAAVRAVAPEALIVVDVVTSLGVADLRPEAWGFDAIVAGSQKGLLLPPGLGLVWLSERAYAEPPDPPRAYATDLHAELSRQAKGETGPTPPVTLVAGAAAVLPELLRDGGPERLWTTRARLNDALLAAGAAIGFAPFARTPSPAVAAMRVPDGLRAPDVVAAFAARNVRIGGGQGPTRDTVIRPSTLGWADGLDVLALAGALESVARELGHDAPYGAAVGAAARVLEAA